MLELDRSVPTIVKERVGIEERRDNRGNVTMCKHLGPSILEVCVCAKEIALGSLEGPRDEDSGLLVKGAG